MSILIAASKKARQVLQTPTEPNTIASIDRVQGHGTSENKFPLPRNQVPPARRLRRTRYPYPAKFHETSRRIRTRRRRLRPLVVRPLPTHGRGAYGRILPGGTLKMASMQIKPMGNGRCSLYEIGTAPAHTAWLRTSLALRCNAPGQTINGFSATPARTIPARTSLYQGAYRRSAY